VKAAVLEQAGQPLQLRDLELRNLADGDVVVRIAATSLCHTV